MLPFVINTAVEIGAAASLSPADVGGGGVRDARQQFCVSPCPSYVYTEAEYRSMWLGHVAVGIVAFAYEL